MNINIYKRFFVAAVLLLTCSTGVAQVQNRFVYRNPISDGIAQGGLRDCQITREGEWWYMTGTCYPVWRGANPGVALYKSKNLLNWEFEKYIVERAALDSAVWYYDRFWAPEIHHIKGKYYVLFNSRNETVTNPHPRGTAVAVSDKIDGTYRVLTEKNPFSEGIDLSFFEDTDGKVYANWHEGDYIMCAEVDMTTMRPRNTVIAISPDSATWDAAGIEGSYMIREGDIYFLFYSSWSRGYEIGYATSDSPMGPWVKSPQNPIYGAQNRESCAKYGSVFTGDDNAPFKHLGHNAVFRGPDGRYWLSCHGIMDGGDPLLILEPMDIENGVIKIGLPSTDIKTVEW